ncbi:hypothetical protein JTB14_026644 [Gonioctena quinquepunctata]|nr:hypothetical protein JTB14_026644 [Gonioctena quinquepunctata]
MTDCKTVSTPIDLNINLNDMQDKTCDVNLPYQEFISSLMTRNRPTGDPQHPNLDIDTPIPQSRGSRTRNISKEHFLKRKQDDASRSPTVTGRSVSSNIPVKTEPNKGNTRNKSNSRAAQTPVSRANVCAALNSKTSIETMLKSKNKENRKIAIETTAHEIAYTDKGAEKVPNDDTKTPTSSPPDKKAKHEEKVLEKVMKVDELLTAHPQVSVFAPDSDVAQVLMDEIETSTLPPPISETNINIATLPPSIEIGGATHDNMEQEARETYALRTGKSKITPLLDIEKQIATLPPPAVEIDSKDASTPPPPEAIQGDTQKTETVNTSIHDSTAWSEQSDDHNKELMDEESDIKKHLDGALNTEELVRKILDEYGDSSSDMSDTNIELHRTDKTSEIPKSESVALDDGRPPVSKNTQHSGIYSCQHCSYDQTHSVMVITEISRDEEIRRPRDLFVTQDLTWKCRSCEGENTEEIRVAVFSDEESNEEEDDEGRRPRAQLIHTEADTQDKPWKSFDEDKLPSYIEGVQSVISTGSSLIQKAQDHVPLSPGADSSTSGQAVEIIPGGAPDASQVTKHPLGPEEPPADGNIKDQVTSTHTPLHSQEGSSGETELSYINKEQYTKKTPSQNSDGFLDTFQRTSSPPKSIPNQEMVFSSDVEKSNFRHTSNYTCANLPQDPLPSSYKGGTVSDPLPNAHYGDSSEIEKDRSEDRVREKSNAVTGEIEKTEFLENKKAEFSKNFTDTILTSDAQMGWKFGSVGDQRKLIERREQVHDLAKLTRLYGEQTFSCMEQNTMEENNLFLTPNMHVRSEDGKYKFSFPIRSAYEVPESGSEKCPNYTSDTNKGVDNQINEERTNPQRTMDVDPERIKYTTVIVKEADSQQQQKKDDELQAQHMAEYNSEYVDQTERDDSSTSSSEEQMETNQIIEQAMIHTNKDNKTEGTNAIKESEVKVDTEKTKIEEIAEMIKKDAELYQEEEKERKAKREEVKKRREAQRNKDKVVKNTENIQEIKTRRKDSLDEIKVIQSDNRNGTISLSIQSHPKPNKDITVDGEKTPSISSMHVPNRNQLTDRLEILSRQVDEEAMEMTENLLDNMIDHNSKFEGPKSILRERIRESVYNTSRELCLKPKEEEIQRITNTIKSKKEENQFISPQKATKTPSPVKNPVLVTKNKYQLLEVEDKETDTGVSEEHSKEILDSMDMENKRKAQQQPAQRVRDRRIPPLVVAGKTLTTQATIRKLKEATKEKFVIEHKPNSTIVLTQTLEDHGAVKRVLEAADLQFHTYTHSDDKTHAFILKGLDSQPEPEEVKQALIDDYKLEIKKVHRYTTKGKKKFVNAPEPEGVNIWTKKAQERENQNSVREARQPGSGAQETQPIHYPPPSNNTQVGAVVSGGFASENSGQGIKALGEKFRILGSLIDIPNMLNDIDKLIQEVQRTTDKFSHRRLLLNFLHGDSVAF